MTERKLRLRVYVGMLLVLTQPSECNHNDGAIRIEDDETRKDTAVRCM